MCNLHDRYSQFGCFIVITFRQDSKVFFLTNMYSKLFGERGEFSMSVVYFVATGLFQIKLIRLMVYLLLIANTLGFLAILYQFILDAELVYIIQYGPIISGSTYALGSLYGIIFLRDAEEFQHGFQFWNEHEGSKETQNRIKQHINSLTVSVILNTALAFVTGTSLILPNKDEIHYHYFIKILMDLETVPRRLSQALYYLYKLNFGALF
nr:PREDICTED: uncharacterized protein LOC107398416 [Tribolium castaneum]|eukprot:XP_015837902.1 PREDICTED: uncharacterized protein LOC107398416 [Tribolium castaneum]